MALPNVSLLSSETDLNLDISEMRKKVLSQKWLLLNWIKLKQTELKDKISPVEKELSDEKRRQKKSSRSSLDIIIENQSQRSDSCSSGKWPTIKSLRKGKCCYRVEEEGIKCQKPSLPFTRHCSQHILYNVDQLLFERCTAKCSNSLTQCSSSTFYVHNEEPLCDLHVKQLAEQATANGQLKDVSGKSTKRKGKSMPLTKPVRRRRKGKTGPEKGGSFDCAEYQNGTVSPQSTSHPLSDSGEPHQPELFSSRIRLPENALHRIVQRTGVLPETVSLTTSPSLTTVSSIHHNASGIVTNPSHLFEATTSASGTVVSSTLSSVHVTDTGSQQGIPQLDMAVPRLAPGEEALVASIVAQLPLGTGDSTTGGPAFDAEFTEVFNNHSDDAFHDLLSMDGNLKGGMTIENPLDVSSHLVNGDSTYDSNSSVVTTTTALHNGHIASITPSVPVAASSLSSTPGCMIPRPVPLAPSHTTTAPLHLPSQATSVTVHHQQQHLLSARSQGATVHQLPPISEITMAPSYIQDDLTPPVSSGAPISITPTKSASSTSSPMNQAGNQLNDDILGIASNLFATLTTEQQQQLNGLIDGALASGSLTSSPTLRTALSGW